MGGFSVYHRSQPLIMVATIHHHRSISQAPPQQLTEGRPTRTKSNSISSSTCPALRNNGPQAHHIKRSIARMVAFMLWSAVLSSSQKAGASSPKFTFAVLISPSLPPSPPSYTTQCPDTHPAHNPPKGLPPCACSRRPSTPADQEEKTEYPHAPRPTVVIIPSINHVSVVPPPPPRQRYAHSLPNLE